MDPVNVWVSSGDTQSIERDFEIRSLLGEGRWREVGSAAKRLLLEGRVKYLAVIEYDPDSKSLKEHTSAFRYEWDNGNLRSLPEYTTYT